MLNDEIEFFLKKKDLKKTKVNPRKLSKFLIIFMRSGLAHRRC
jgi:hypothetical protein